jgi:hypothetical protein
MPIKKIKNPDSWNSKMGGPCLHPEHKPPQHMVFEPGTYEHTCPACGKKIVFVVPSITH